MKAAILQCDSVLEKFQSRFGDYPAMVRQMFDGIDPALSFDTFDCRQGQFPADIDAYDFYLTTGSRASVYDDQPWIRPLVNFIRQLDKNNKKLIGICFGHQLIALARGGRVEKSDRGWGIGVATNPVLVHPAWMVEKPAAINILVSHQDQISELPGNTTVIAGNDFCPFFIVQWGEHFISIQGHPEWKTAYSEALINDRKTIIPADRIKTGLDSLAIEPDNPIFIRWIMEFVRYSHS